jgi:hypothetical protein
LRSLHTVLKDSFLTGISTSKPAPKPVILKKPVQPTPKKAYSNANLLTISPKSFLLLPPNLRARKMALMKAQGKGAKKPQFLTLPKAKAVSPKNSPNGRWGVRISPSHLRGAKFKNLVLKFVNANKSNVPFENKLNKARLAAEKFVTLRIMAGRSPFTPKLSKA